MTTTKEKEVADPIGDALAEATSKRYAWMRAQGDCSKVMEEVAGKIAKAKTIYEKVVSNQNELTSEAQKVVDAAYENLMTYQAQMSEELGVELNVVLEPAAGRSKSL